MSSPIDRSKSVSATAEHAAHDMERRNHRIRMKQMRQESIHMAAVEQDRADEESNALNDMRDMLNEIGVARNPGWNQKYARQVTNLVNVAGMTMPINSNVPWLEGLIALSDWEEFFSDSQELSDEEFSSKLGDFADSIMLESTEDLAMMPAKILSKLEQFLNKNGFSNSPAFVYASLVNVAHKLADEAKDEERAMGMCAAIDELLVKIEEQDGAEILSTFRLSKNKKVQKLAKKNPKVLDSIRKLELGNYEIRNFMNEAFALLKVVDFERLVPAIMQFRMHIISEVSNRNSFEHKHKLDTFVGLEQTLILVNSLYKLLKNCAIPIANQDEYAKANTLIIKDVMRTLNVLDVLKKPNMNYVNDFLLLWYERDKNHATYEDLNHKIGVFINRLPIMLISASEKEMLMEMFLKLLENKFGHKKTLTEKYLDKKNVSVVFP
jgi:hypothetical protein